MKTPPIPKDRKKYPLWVPITIPITKAEMMFYVGGKCRCREPNCHINRLWAAWEKTGRIRTIVERRADVLTIRETP